MFLPTVVPRCDAIPQHPFSFSSILWCFNFSSPFVSSPACPLSSGFLRILHVPAFLGGWPTGAICTVRIYGFLPCGRTDGQIVTRDREPGGVAAHIAPSVSENCRQPDAVTEIAAPAGEGNQPAREIMSGWGGRGQVSSRPGAWQESLVGWAELCSSRKAVLLMATLM